MAKVLLDFDSTLTMFDEHVLATCNERHGTSYAPECLTDWDVLGKLEPRGFVWGADCWQSREWQLSVPPQPGAIETVLAMRAAGLEPIVVSDRSVEAIRCTREWLAMHGLAELDVIASHCISRPKVHVARDYGMAFAIEDAPHHAIDLAGAGIPVYLMDKPYNREVIENDLITRVHGGWQELGELLGISMVEGWAA